MYAAVTLVHFENRITGQPGAKSLPRPAPRVRSLSECYVEVDPDTREPVPGDLQTLDRGPIDACVFVAPKGEIRVLIYATGEVQPAEDGILDGPEDVESFPFERFHP